MKHADKTAVFRNRKANLWYMRTDQQYFDSVKSMVKNMIKDLRAACVHKQALNHLKFEQQVQFSEMELHVVELTTFQNHVLEDLNFLYLFIVQYMNFPCDILPLIASFTSKIQGFQGSNSPI